MHSFHHSDAFITSDGMSPVELGNMDTGVSFDDPQKALFDPSSSNDDAFVHAASHAFEDGSNSSDSDPSRNSKEGVGISKANFDQLNEQEKREMNQRIWSQDNIHSDDDTDGKAKSKKYKTGKGKLQKMGNAADRSAAPGSLLCVVVVSLIGLIVNV